MAKSQVDDGSFCNIQQAKALMLQPNELNWSDEQPQGS